MRFNLCVFRFHVNLFQTISHYSAHLLTIRWYCLSRNLPHFLSISPPLSWYLAFMCLIRPQSVQSMIKNTNDPHYWPLLLGESTGDRWIPLASTETEMLSFWRNFHHWLHWKLSIWQLPVQPVVKVSSKWQHFRFSESPVMCKMCPSHDVIMEYFFLVSQRTVPFPRPKVLVEVNSPATTITRRLRPVTSLYGEDAGATATVSWLGAIVWTSVTRVVSLCFRLVVLVVLSAVD